MGDDASFRRVHAARTREFIGMSLAFLGAVCWGFSATCVSWLTNEANVDVIWLADVRMLVAGGLFFIVALVRDRDKLKALVRDRALMVRIVAYTAIGVMLMQVSYMSAIKYTNPGTALLLQETGVPLVVLVSCVRMKRLPSKAEAIALALAFIGIVLISTQGDITSLAIDPLGLFWGLAAGVAMMGYILVPVRLTEECGPFVTNGVALLAGGIAFLPFARPWEGVQLDGAGWLVVGGVVVVGTMVAYVVYLRGVVEAGPVKASLVGLFEPVSGAIISALWLGTVFSVWDYIGGAAIIAMMVVVALRK